MEHTQSHSIAQSIVHHTLATFLHVPLSSIDDAQSLDVDLGMTPLLFVVVTVRLEELAPQKGVLPIHEVWKGPRTVGALIEVFDAWWQPSPANDKPELSLRQAGS